MIRDGLAIAGCLVALAGLSMMSLPWALVAAGAMTILGAVIWASFK